MTALSIKKFSGQKEDFSDQKLLDSLIRAGSSQEVAEKILRFVKKKLYPDMTTSEIYRLAFGQLKKQSKIYAANYSLKKAIFHLGPSGYFFEKFVSLIFKELGYDTEIEKIFRGRCISHEVDVVAKKEDHTIFMECKFHNAQSKKSDVKTALYVQARHLDLKESSEAPDFDDFYLVTNSVFTKDALEYSQCAGLKLIGLNTTEDKNLHDIIKDLSLHPLTCLKKMRVRDKTKLMEDGIMLCRQITENSSLLDEIGLHSSEKRAILNEIKAITLGHQKKIARENNRLSEIEK